MDLETKDPHLKTLGPGWTTGDGQIVGIALAAGDWENYYPIRHFGGGNLDPNMTLRWLKDELQTYTGTILLANAQYDLGWLRREGIDPKCSIRDVQLVEPLLDEERRSYSLDALATDYLGIGKDEKDLRTAASTFGVDPKGEMWKLHAKYVGPYAEMDARLTYDIYQKQLPLIRSEGVEKILELEHQVLPILLAMAERGVRIDMEAAIQLDDEWGSQEKKLLKKIGISADDLWTQGFLLHMFEKKNLTHPRTPPTKGNPNGQPSFPKEFLREHEDPDIRRVANARELSRLRSIYVRKRIIDDSIGGRVFPHYKQLASDEGGTATGRLACRGHNLQQSPKRSQFVDAKRLRALYLPEEEEQWLGADYDSQEPRLQIHYGLRLKLRGAEEAKNYVAEGKKLYHLIQDSANCTYNQAKTIYLGLSYGMGVKKLSEGLGVSEEVAQNTILAPLMKKCPFMKLFSEATAKRAGSRGYVKTILGRKRRFKKWQSSKHWEYKRDARQRELSGKMDSKYWWLKHAGGVFETLEKAQEFFEGNHDQFERAFTNKAGNAVIQGSAADQTKAAMVDVFRETGRIPISQVHDELNYSVSGQEEADRIKYLMENAVDLELPTKADCELGTHW